MANVQLAVAGDDTTQVILSVPGVQGPTGSSIPPSGTTNQILFKQSNTDYDTAWSFVTNAMVDSSAAIAGTKISPNFGSQNVVTTGTSTAASFIPTSSSVPTNGVYLPSANNVAISTNGTGRLFISSTGEIGVGAAASTWNLGKSIEIDGTDPVAIWNPGDGFNAISNTYYNSGYKFKTNGGYGLYYQQNTGSGAHVFATTTATGTADGAATFSELARITADGKLGLGTSSPGTILDARGIVSIGSANNSNAIIQKSAVPIGSFNLTITSGGGLTSESATTPTDALAGSVIKLLGGDPTTDTFGGGIQYYANGSTSPNGAGVGNQHVFYTRSAANTYTERLRIDSAGRVGIGTTGPTSPLHISNSTNPKVYLERPGQDALELGVESGVAPYIACGTSLTFRSGGSTSADEKARITSSGQLLVGTSSGQGTSLLQVQGTTSSSTVGGNVSLRRGSLPSVLGAGLGFIEFGDNAGNIGATIGALAEGSWTSGSNHRSYLEFSTTSDGASSPTERMRITSAGRASIYGDTDVFRLASNQGGGTAFTLIEARNSETSTTSTSGAVAFRVYTNGDTQNTNNSYAGTSDAKLKENIVDANSQWDDLKALQVRNYNFKEGQTHRQIGLVAQEVELVSPGLVSESPDRDKDGNDLGTVTKSVRYSVLYMKAVKALQEAMERIETLEAKVAALEAQ
jgi:hypothetical protein